MPASKISRKTTVRKGFAGAAATLKLLAMVLNASLRPKERVAAMSQVGSDVISDRPAFNAVIRLLRNPNEDSTLRNEALSALQAATFEPVPFARYRVAYMAALRALRADPDGEIRQRAFGILAREQDSDTQAVLLAGLNDPTQALLTPEKALQLLSYDPHAGAYDAARKIAESPPNPLARREALRVLAADAQSVDLFERVLRDKTESTPIRQLAASSLNQLAPQRLQVCARDIAVDAGEADDMKSLGLTALTHFGDAQALSNDRVLQDQVDTIQGRPAAEGSSTLKVAAQKFKQRYS